MAGLTLAPEGSGSLAKLQLLCELLHLRSGWTQGCRMSENKQKKGSSRNLHNVCILKQQYTTTLKLRLMGQNTIVAVPGTNRTLFRCIFQSHSQVDENLVYYFMWPNVCKYQNKMLSPYFLN